MNSDFHAIMDPKTAPKVPAWGGRADGTMLAYAGKRTSIRWTDEKGRAIHQIYKIAKVPLGGGKWGVRYELDY